MAAIKPKQSLANIRGRIAAKTRELRQSRGWTQAELAKQLRISQSRLSEIERGGGSFSAEQFLVLLRLFNASVSDFASEPINDEGLALQNALARLGALHLQESTKVLPSRQLEAVHDVLREAILDGSPRVITAIAPVLVRNAERLNLPKLFADLERAGRQHRLAWVVDNTLVALRALLQEPTRARAWAKLERRAEVTLNLFLASVDTDRFDPTRSPPPPDVLDTTIRSERSLEEVRRSGSEASRHWGIISSLHPDDFLRALRAARAGD
jgi:transcriptional regulator with XRE-family HTH domain